MRSRSRSNNNYQKYHDKGNGKREEGEGKYATIDSAGNVRSSSSTPTCLHTPHISAIVGMCSPSAATTGASAREVLEDIYQTEEHHTVLYNMNEQAAMKQNCNMIMMTATTDSCEKEFLPLENEHAEAHLREHAHETSHDSSNETYENDMSHDTYDNETYDNDDTSSNEEEEEEEPPLQANVIQYGHHQQYSLQKLFSLAHQEVKEQEQHQQSEQQHQQQEQQRSTCTVLKKPSFSVPTLFNERKPTKHTNVVATPPPPPPPPPPMMYTTLEDKNNNHNHTVAPHQSMNMLSYTTIEDADHTTNADTTTVHTTTGTTTPHSIHIVSSSRNNNNTTTTMHYNTKQQQWKMKVLYTSGLVIFVTMCVFFGMGGYIIYSNNHPTTRS